MKGSTFRDGLAIMIIIFLLLVIIYFCLEIVLPIYTQDSMGLMDSIEIKEAK